MESANPNSWGSTEPLRRRPDDPILPESLLGPAWSEITDAERTGARVQSSASVLAGELACDQTVAVADTTPLKTVYVVTKRPVEAVD